MSEDIDELNKLCSNFSDIKIRKSIIDQYSSLDTMLAGNNENGETVELHISSKTYAEGTINSHTLIVRTYQSNGWVRVNYYDGNGEESGETFEGKWK